jgi:hypothetical protein
MLAVRNSLELSRAHTPNPLWCMMPYYDMTTLTYYGARVRGMADQNNDL